MPSRRSTELIHFRSAATSLVIEPLQSGLPRVVHWGADLGDLGHDDLVALAAAQVPQQVSNTVDAPAPVGVLTEHAHGWMGTPGLTGHRDGAGFSTSFRLGTTTVESGPAGEQRLVAEATDPVAAVELTLEIELTASGLLRQRASVTNTAPGPFTVDGLQLALPVPARATELLDLTGRHLRERSPQRAPFTIGTHLRENRRGRTGLDASLVLVAGVDGFGFRDGEVWGIHVAWSGNHRMLAERTPSGESILAGGELLMSGEIRLGETQRYTSPWVYFSYGHGLDELSRRFHQHLRARRIHPVSPRPVTMNTWEAVYFDHDVEQLVRLADLAAEAGVERYVLDDGWFRHRRSDRAGLGDWYVDQSVWPDGLHPLVDHVTKLDMQFGLWVEPEMVNLDSDLARAHPEWIMGTGDRLPPEARHQQVLDLGHDDAFAYILERLDVLLTEYQISYLKWDHNRDLVDAGHGPSGTPGVHRQTAAAYRLIDELRDRHPDVEIESCSSGGGRVDLGILERTDRVWASDCIDALERQQIQRWTGLLVPPEMIGAHVGATLSHSTGRRHTVGFRAGTALFGHFGIEWDLTSATRDELAELREWVKLYKRIRALLHTGDVVHADHPDPALWLHGVVSPDRSRAVYAIVQIATSVQSPAGTILLPGLDPAARYRLRPLAPGDRLDGPARSPLPWWTDGTELPGHLLTAAGVQAPTMHPERIALVEAVRVDLADVGQGGARS